MTNLTIFWGLRGLNRIMVLLQCFSYRQVYSNVLRKRNILQNTGYRLSWHLYTASSQEKFACCVSVPDCLKAVCTSLVVRLFPLVSTCFYSSPVCPSHLSDCMCVYLSFISSLFCFFIRSFVGPSFFHSFTHPIIYSLLRTVSPSVVCLTLCLPACLPAIVCWSVCLSVCRCACLLFP